ncbi:MAG: hypothetical protein D4R90_00720 [Nitrosopumilales archaeon]|nr:MAG: hypothetical protein D4R90_00720 [Nitrosopumilales archaeon]
MSITKTYFAKFFTRKLAIKFVIPIFVVMLFVPSTISSFNAYGQVGARDCFAPLTTILDSSYQGPVVVDSYWVDQGTSTTSDTTSNPIKKEIGPGEGASVFAVVLNNRGALPLQSVTAFLNLPSGFKPTGESANPQLLEKFSQAAQAANNPAVGNYYGTVQPGTSFTVYFNINVLPTAKTGTFSTTLVANYNQQGVVGQSCTSALLNVPFVLPGKVILDASAGTTDIPPQTKSDISIIIENKGSADATGVIATIVNLGNTKGGTGSTGSGNSVVLSSSTTQLVNLGANTFNIGTIHAKSKSVISTTVYPSSSASGSTQEIQIQVSYQNGWGKLSNVFFNTGLVVAPNPPQSITLSYLGNETTPLITAGNLGTGSFAVSNNSNDTMSNVIISLVPQSTSVSIVGTSTWTIQNLQPGERQVLSTKVFAANSLINTPTSFTLTANYVSRGQSQSNSLTLGAFVVGSIKLQLYDLSVSSSGGTPGITGNLLNQGSTTGLFTTIQLAPSPLLDAIRTARIANFTSDQTQGGQGFQGQNAPGQGGSGFQGQNAPGQGGSGFQGQGGNRPRGSTQQFIGDLTPDSPIPFSIPIRGISSLQPGMYPIAFKVTYADDLKNSHTVILNGTVNIGRNLQSTNSVSQPSIFDQILSPSIIGAIIAIVAVAIFLTRRKRSKNKKLKLVAQGDNDIVSIFDSVKKKDES